MTNLLWLFGVLRPHTPVTNFLTKTLQP